MIKYPSVEDEARLSKQYRNILRTLKKNLIKKHCRIVKYKDLPPQILEKVKRGEIIWFSLCVLILKEGRIIFDVIIIAFLMLLLFIFGLFLYIYTQVEKYENIKQDVLLTYCYSKMFNIRGGT